MVTGVEIAAQNAGVSAVDNAVEGTGAGVRCFRGLLALAWGARSGEVAPGGGWEGRREGRGGCREEGVGWGGARGGGEHEGGQEQAGKKGG